MIQISRRNRVGILSLPDRLAVLASQYFMKLYSQFDSDLPKYQSIALSLLDNYKSGGDALSRSQLQLAKDFEVNRLTIRHAFQWLQRSHPAVFQAKRKKGASPAESPHASTRTTIGFPIFADSFASQRLQRLIRHFKLAETAHDELRKHGFALDVQWVGSSAAPDLEKIRHLCELWEAAIVEPLPGFNSIGPEHPFYQKRDRLAMIGVLQETHHNCIYPDFYHAAQLAINEFARLGAKNILYTGSEHELLAFRLVPILGAEKTVETVPGMKMQFAEGSPELEGAFSSVKNFFLQGGKCDAILACNPFSSMGALRALADLKIRVPEDVQLIGIGRVPFGEFLVPKPTTIGTDMQALGQAAARTAMALVQTQGQPQPNTIVPMNLMIGETTRHEQPRTERPIAVPQKSDSLQFLNS